MNGPPTGDTLAASPAAGSVSPRPVGGLHGVTQAHAVVTVSRVAAIETLRMQAAVARVFGDSGEADRLDTLATNLEDARGA